MKQIITFRIGQHLLGIDVATVQEIGRIPTITPVPQAPLYVRGIVNLRGDIVVVFDLGKRLDLGEAEESHRKHLVILKDVLVSFLVDELLDVLQIDETEILSPPANLNRINRRFVDGVVSREDDLLILLSADEILKYDKLKRS